VVGFAAGSNAGISPCCGDARVQGWEAGRRFCGQFRQTAWDATAVAAYLLAPFLVGFEFDEHVSSASARPHPAPCGSRQVRRVDFQLVHARSLVVGQAGRTGIVVVHVVHQVGHFLDVPMPSMLASRLPIARVSSSLPVIA
jgi:hypothetical protein